MKNMTANSFQHPAKLALLSLIIVSSVPVWWHFHQVETPKLSKSGDTHANVQDLRARVFNKPVPRIEAVQPLGDFDEGDFDETQEEEADEPKDETEESVAELEDIPVDAVPEKGCGSERDPELEFMHGWRAALPPPLEVPGHAQLILSQAMMQHEHPGATVRPGGRQAGGWPGELKVAALGLEYELSGEGLLRAEPNMPGGTAFRIRNSKQKSGTHDSFFVRLVGPSIVVGEVRRVRNQPIEENIELTTYNCIYTLREPGLYSLQVWLEYRDLPWDIGELKNPKGDSPDPLVANANTFPRHDILLYTAFVDGRYVSESAASAGERARELMLNDGGEEGEEDDKTVVVHSPADCAALFLPGRWVPMPPDLCPEDSWQLIRDTWMWRPNQCRIHTFCKDQATACLKSQKVITVAGDSIARELFDDIGSALLQRDVSWREIFSHKHASGTRQVGNTRIRMLWLPDPLKTIKEQLLGGVQNKEQYTDCDVLVISAGYWYIYRTSLSYFLGAMVELAEVTAKVLPRRTRVVWVSIPSGWMNFGYRIRPRLVHWNTAASSQALKFGWKVLDTFHLSDARPEKMDGTHFGNDTDRMNIQGRPVLSRAALNLLLGILCGDGKVPGLSPSNFATSTPTVNFNLEWPNWPNSRKYIGSEAILQAKQQQQQKQSKRKHKP